MGHRQSHKVPAETRASVARRWTGLLLLPLLVGVFAPPVLPQSEVSKSAVLRELERTDRIIEKAGEIAREATAFSSYGHLQVAIDIQRKAWTTFRAGLLTANPDRFFERALQLTGRARREALKAMDATRIERKTQDSVQLAVDRVQERIQEVGQWVRDSGDPLANRVFDQGIEQLRRARRANLDRRYAQAARLAVLALSLIDRAGRIAHGELTAGAAVETSIERTAALLAQVEATLIERGQAPGEPPLLKEAWRLVKLAGVRLREGRARQALRLSLAARQKGLQLLGEMNQEPGEQALLELIEDLQALYAEMGPEIESVGSEKDRRTVAEGRKMLRRARVLVKEGKPRKALQHLLAAERLLKRAAQSAGI